MSEAAETSLAWRVTEAHVFRIVGGRPGFVGYAKIILNNSLLLDGLEVHQNCAGRYWLKYPEQESEDGRKFRFWHPLFPELDDRILKAVIKAVDPESNLSGPFSKPRHDLERAAKRGL